MKKKSVSITIDSLIWELAKDKLECSRSEFLEEQLRKAIGLADDEETKLRKKITEHQNEINVLESKLCKIRENKRKTVEEEKDLTEIIETFERIHNYNNIVGKNQLKNMAKTHNVEVGIIADLAIDMGLDIRENYEPPR